MISVIKILENPSYFIVTESRVVVVWALEGRGGKEILQWDTKVTFWGDGLLHYLYSENVHVYTCQNIKLDLKYS